MSFLNTLINRLNDEEIKESLEDRLAIIEHKIKFMDPVPVIFMSADNLAVNDFDHLLAYAGAEVQPGPATARAMVYTQPGKDMLQLIGEIPALLDSNWPSVTYDRVYLWNGVQSDSAEHLIAAIEDLAEMFYPGQFIFGNEGITWMSFKTK